MAWYLNSFRWWPRFKFHKIFRCVFLYAEVTVILVTTILAYSIILSFSLKLMLLPSGQYLDSCQTWYMCSSFNTFYQSQISNQFGYACANSINLYEVCNSNYLSPPMKKIIKVWQIIDYCELNEICCVVRWQLWQCLGVACPNIRLIILNTITIQIYTYLSIYIWPPVVSNAWDGRRPWETIRDYRRS